MKKRLGMSEHLADIIKKKQQDSARNNHAPVLPEEHLFFVENGQIYRTTLYTKNQNDFISWVLWTHPMLKNYPKDLKELASNMESRKQLLTAAQNGISLGRTMRDPQDGFPLPLTYNNKGH